MGSRRTHDDRMARLQEAGLTDDELARLSSPVGLDLGARTPEETAVSIAAEIIALRWGGKGERLAARRAASTTEPPTADQGSSGALTCRSERSSNLAAVTLVSGRQSGNDRHNCTHDARVGPGDVDDPDQCHRRRSDVLRRRRTPHASRPLPARTARQDRHRRRLRHQQLRRLHRPPRRPQREVLQRARRPGRRSRGHHHRGSGAGRRAAPDAGRLPRVPRAAVRLLHARA